jgi:glycosyltransferase involved in cell wall biosynthesis
MAEMVSAKATIVICTLNRKESLDLVVGDIWKQTYKNFEIIVSDEIGITNAMNTSLKKATGDIIIRIDDDVRLPENWLEEIMFVFNEYPDAGGVTGPTIVPQELRKNRDLFTFDKLPNPIRWVYINYFQEGNPYALAKMNRCGAFSLGSNFETALLEPDIIQCDYLESTNYCLRTNLVKAMGGWDPKFDGVCEYFEQDMVYKIKGWGWKMYYNPHAYLFHMVNTGGNYGARMDFVSRLRNWLRFVYRHLHPGRNAVRLLMYFLFQCAYYACTTFKSWRSK